MEDIIDREQGKNFIQSSFSIIHHSVDLSDQSESHPSRKSHGSWSGSTTTDEDDDDDDDDDDGVGTIKSSTTTGSTIKNFLLYGRMICNKGFSHLLDCVDESS